MSAADVFADRPEYYPAGFVEAVRMLEAMGDYDRTLRRWADEEVIEYRRDVRPFDARLWGLVEEHAELFGYAEGGNHYERILVLLERVTMRKDVVAALADEKS